MAALTYADAGVDRDSADRLVQRIATLAKTTYGKHRTKLRSSIGGYASLYEIDKKRWLAASTDGVGTKLKLAFELGSHTTVGIDLVAMSVNDLICVGAEPLFFLDYFATGKLQSETALHVLEGISEGCRQAQCALVGGETAEMPDFYSPGEYDLGGFAIGMVDPKKSLPQKEIRAGDVLLGLASSGCHSNGYSLLRKLVPEGREGQSIAADLLTPTKIYVSSLMPLIQKKKVKGLAHITGSGFLNVPRMSTRVNYEIQLPPPEETAPVFKWVREKSQLGIHELASTFNMGVGMVLVVSPREQGQVVQMLKRRGEKVWTLGHVTSKRKTQDCDSEVIVRDWDGSAATLRY